MSDESDDLTERYLRVIALARRQGASIRNIAKMLNVSKSTAHRWMPGIDALVSQMGQGEGAEGRSDAVSEDASVPDGT
jgi:transposase